MSEHSTRRTIRYFLSYAHADEADVKRFLAVMETQLETSAEYDFQLWSDKHIQPGELWKMQIEKALAECGFGLLLVSPAFLRSPFIVKTELPELLKKAMVVPVGLHRVLFDGSMDLKGLGERQLFLDSKGRTFDACGRMTGRRDFALELFSRITSQLHGEAAGGVAKLEVRGEEQRPAVTGLAVAPPVAVALVAPMTAPAAARKPEADALLAELQREATTHERRWAIGQRLAEIGDPRPGVGVIDGVPDFLWRAIPGIEQVKPFQMAAYAVTAGQFRAFVAAKDGYGDQRWWKDSKQGTPASKWEKMTANHSVTDVSWNDATAYCRWVSERVGYAVRLADEAEWEWAARSAEPGYEYPWGAKWRDGVANTSESGLMRTTAVGMYPAGESAQQVADLAGNVWEWCENRYRSGEEWLVLRGGAWLNNLGRARGGSLSLSSGQP